MKSDHDVPPPPLDDEADLKALRANIKVGLDQIAAGKARPFNAERIVKAGERLPAKKR